MRRRLLIAAIILATLIIVAPRVAAPVARPALGFVAKVICSGIFVGGMPVERALADLPDEPLARLIRTHIDTVTHTVRARLPLVASREAVHRAGLGCTLRPATGDLVALPLSGAARTSSAESTAEWPAGDRANTGADGDRADTNARAGWNPVRLRAALDAGFAEPDAAVPRRTRAIVVVHGGRIIAERYADGFTPQHRFAGWSMAKSVTAALVGILIGEGRLHLHETGVHPSWRSAGDERGAITLEHLLHMSSGLDFDESYTPRGAATRMLFAAPDVAASGAASPLAQQPGTVWSYSSATTNVIAYRIREVLGDVAYADYPRHVLFDRIGMRDVVLEPDAAGTFVGSSFMYATARDWARFGLLFLRDGLWDGVRVLPDRWVRYSVAPAPAAPLGRYGAHWWLNAGTRDDSTRRPWPELPADMYWAGGFQGQYVVVVPSHDLVVVRLGVSAREGAWELRRFIGALLSARTVAGGPEVALSQVLASE